MMTNFLTAVPKNSNLEAVRLPAQQGSMDLKTFRERLMSAWKPVRPKYYGLPQKSNFWDGVGIDVRQPVGMSRSCHNRAVGYLFNPLKKPTMNKTAWIKIFLMISAFTRQHRKSCSGFYIGITDNIERRLREHKVNPSDPCSCIYFRAYNFKVAQNIERLFLKRGMKRAPGGGNDDSVYVYCYKITPSTLQ